MCGFVNLSWVFVCLLFSTFVCGVVLERFCAACAATVDVMHLVSALASRAFRA